MRCLNDAADTAWRKCRADTPRYDSAYKPDFNKPLSSDNSERADEDTITIDVVPPQYDV